MFNVRLAARQERFPSDPELLASAAPSPAPAVDERSTPPARAYAAGPGMAAVRAEADRAASTRRLVADAADEEVISREMLKALAYREAMRQKHSELAAAAKGHTDGRRRARKPDAVPTPPRAPSFAWSAVPRGECRAAQAGMCGLVLMLFCCCRLSVSPHCAASLSRASVATTAEGKYA